MRYVFTPSGAGIDLVDVYATGTLVGRLERHGTNDHRRWSAYTLDGVLLRPRYPSREAAARALYSLHRSSRSLR